MVNLLRKLTPESVVKIHRIVTAVLVIVMALFTARLVSVGVTMLVEDAKGIQPPKAIAKPFGRVRRRVKGKDLSDYNIIITRNIFNSKGEIPEDEVIDIAEPGADVVKKSRLDLELVGTIVVSDSSRSVAAINLKKERKIEPFMIGDAVLTNIVVASIARKKVVLKNSISGELEFIEILEEELPTPVKTKAVPSSGIRHLSEDHILLDRSEVNRALTNINELLMQARAVPHMEGGKIAGFKLFGIQPGSLYEKLGAKNGDIIKSVNGVAIRDPSTAMGLYQQLQTRNKFEITINRGGEDKAITIDIR